MQFGLSLDITPPTGPLSTKGWIGSVDFSDDGLYRYALTREWPDGEGTALFCMVNPSKAGADKNDNTVTRVCGFVRAIRIRKLIVCNLFAFIATDPKDLLAAADAGIDVIGPRNDVTIAEHAAQASRIVVAWGAFNWARKRALHVCSLGGPLDGRALECLDITSDGAPGHPRLLPKSAEFRSYSMEDLGRWASEKNRGRGKS